MKTACPIQKVEAAAYTFPTDGPEADGTLQWRSTSVLVVHVTCGNETGIGYAYTSPGAATVVRDVLGEQLVGEDALCSARLFSIMRRAVRNLGRSGIAASAIAAVDVALWDLKARLLDVSLLQLLGAARDSIDVYGSGGFTNQPLSEIEKQFVVWLEQGVSMVKMKIGLGAKQDIARVTAIRQFVGADVELFVDANGAYSRKQALAMAQHFEAQGVTWFEEPVSSDDREGLRFVREHMPAGINVAAGEYGYIQDDFRHLLVEQSVDVLQADATRCQGVTGFMQAGLLADVFKVPFSAHTAPALHVPLACAVPRAVHVEYFFDHVRLESVFFDGVPALKLGKLVPHVHCLGLGLTLKTADVERFRATG